VLGTPPGLAPKDGPPVHEKYSATASVAPATQGPFPVPTLTGGTMKTPKHSGRHDSFGGAVRETRARRSLSQEELGARARLHRNYVGAIERGEINPTLRVLYKLARGLELPAWEILKLTDERHNERIHARSLERLAQAQGAAKVVRR